MQRIMKHLSQIKNNVLHSNSNDGDSAKKFEYLLNVEHLQIYTKKYVYSCHEIISWFDKVDLSMIKSLKLNVLRDNCVKINTNDDIQFFGYDNGKVLYITYNHKQIKHCGYFDTDRITDYVHKSETCCSAATWQRLIDIISQWNRLIDQFNCKIPKSKSIDGINLVMLIDVSKGDVWMNVSTDLSKSAKLVNVIQSLYNWYQSGNVGANLLFRVLHVIDQSCIKKDTYTQKSSQHGPVKSKKIRVNKDLRKQGWIQLIVKALTSIFKCQSDWNNNDFYPFGLFDNHEQVKCIKLLDRATVKLFAPIWVNWWENIVETTLCFTIKPCEM